MGDNRSAEQKASAPSTPSASPSASSTPSSSPSASSTSTPTPQASSSGNSSGSSKSKSAPTPRPSPGPAPKRHPSGKGYVPPDDTKQHPDDVENKKKIAIDYVVSTFNSARSDIGADYDHTGAKSPSDKHIQSTGLGTDGSVWKSTLANAKREEIAGALTAITREFNWKCEDCFQDFKSEPDWVPKDDSRAKWRY